MSLTADEYDCVIDAAISGGIGATADDERVRSFIEWAERARHNGFLVDLVLAKKRVPTLNEHGEVVFEEVQS